MRWAVPFKLLQYMNSEKQHIYNSNFFITFAKESNFDFLIPRTLIFQTMNFDK